MTPPPFNGPFSGTTWVSWYQKGETNLDFTEATDSQWQWHQLNHMQDCISLQTDNHASAPPLVFLQAGCPSCCPTNSVKALKAHENHIYHMKTKDKFLTTSLWACHSENIPAGWMRPSYFPQCCHLSIQFLCQVHQFVTNYQKTPVDSS